MSQVAKFSPRAPWRRGISVAAVTCALLSHVSWAAAQDDSATRSAVRELGTEGVRAYQAGDYKTAVTKLDQAYRSLPVPSLALWSARALEKNGALVEASERYLEAMRAKIEAGGDQEIQLKAQKEAEREREELLPRLPKLTVTIEGASAEEVHLEVDGKTVVSTLIGAPIPVNPGKIEVTGRLGEEVVHETSMLKEGQKAAVVLHFTPRKGGTVATTEEESPHGFRRHQALLGWIGVGVGAAGAVLGTTTGIMALSHQKSLGCDGNGCPATTDDQDLSRGNTLRTLSTTGFIVGGVFAAAGVGLLLTAPRKPSSETQAYVAPYLGLASFGMKGAF